MMRAEHKAPSNDEGKPWPATATVALSVAVALLANLFLALVNKGQFATQPPVPFSPPGYVIGIVWLFLFAAMGAAYRSQRVEAPEDGVSRIGVVLLIVLCALYPVYTDRLRSLILGLIGAVVVLLLNTWLLARLWPLARRAATLLLPLEAWLLFACYLIVAEMRLPQR